MDAKAIADKYIARDGSAPVKGAVYVKPIIRELVDQGKVEMLSCVVHFIAYHSKNDFHGGHTADAAWKSLCCILDVDDDDFKNLIRPPQP